MCNIHNNKLLIFKIHNETISDIEYEIHRNKLNFCFDQGSIRALLPLKLNGWN